MFFFLHCLANVSKNRSEISSKDSMVLAIGRFWRPPKVNMTSVQHDFGQYKPCTAILMIQYLYVYIYNIYISIQFYTMVQKKDAPSGLMAILLGGFNPPENKYIYIYRDIYSSNGIIIGRKKQTYIYNIIENIYIYLYIYIYTYKYQCIYI